MFKTPRSLIIKRVSLFHNIPHRTLRIFVLLLTIRLWAGLPLPVFSAEHPLPISYNWIPQYYGKINGESKLLYTRGFARSQLRFADLDGDGDNDLFVGKADGRIALFRNTGSSITAKFVLESEDLTVISEGMDEQKNLTHEQTILDVGENASPELADIDSDGDLDLFVGSKDGHIFHYENRGNRLLPRFFRTTPIYMGLKFNGNSVPRFADVNGDRAPDLLVGTRRGKIHLFFNSGVTTEAVFCPEFDVAAPPDSRCKYQPEVVGDIAPLVDAVPELVDWDQDGDWDLVVGKSNGKLNFYLNRGDRFAPNWSLESQHFQFIDTGGIVAPTLHDLDGDSYPELFLGTSTSQVFYYENREVVMDRLRRIKQLPLEKLDPTASLEVLLEQACAELKGLPECLIPLAQAFEVPEGVKIGKMEELHPYLLRPDISMDSTPVAVQESGETPTTTETEKEALQANTKIPLQANTEEVAAPENAEATPEDGTPETKDTAENEAKTKEAESKLVITRNQLWLATRNFFNISRLAGNEQHTLIAGGDWNQDGRNDILLGSRSGKIYAFENHADNGTDWRVINFPALEANRRRHSAPLLSDIDADGDLDIILGNRQGRIEWLLNSGTAKKPKWETHDVHLSQIDVGSYSVPSLSDLDGDGDLDLVVGNSKGLGIYYENQGTKNAPRFILRNTRFSGIRLKKGYAAPVFWKWNEDEHADLLMGGRDGFLSLASHQPPEKNPALRGWNLETIRWQNISTVGYSTPHFTDLDGDKKPDLLMGDEQGNLLYWKNGGAQKIAETPPKSAIVLTANTLEVETPSEDSTTPVETLIQIQEEEYDEPIEPKFELVSAQYGNLQLGRRAAPAFLDIDGDGDLDLIVGNNSGELRYYQNEKNSEDLIQWVLVTKQFMSYQGGRNAAPTFADLDGDGDADLLVGNESGSVHYWENKGNVDLPEFIPNPTPFIGVTGGRNSVPAVLDLNRDGRNDLLIGNFKGQMRKYLRRESAGTSGASDNNFRFRLEMRRYMNLDVGLGAVPKIVDLNNDRQPDLIIGSDTGKLISFQPDLKTADIWGWKPAPEYFKELKLPVGGTPVFVDLDKDGDLDMIIGSEKGTLHYYRNTGK